jgi:Tfp pilus assembly protein PilZ
VKERRAHPREHRRVHLVFWDREAPDDRRTGFTTDTSPRGAFITTHRPLCSGTRLQVELARHPGTFLAEALVVRSVTVPPDLRKLRPGGMGVRFLGFDAYLEELELADRAEAGPEADAEDAGTARETEAPAPAVGTSRPRRRTDFEREREGIDPARLHPAASPIRRTDERTGEERGRPTEPIQRFRVAFATLEELSEAFERDLHLGGLFVPTGAPAPVGSHVAVSLDLPQGRGSIEVTARVAQALPAGTAARSGMGILVDDAEGLADDLRRILESA